MAIEENIRRAMRGTGSPRHADALIADVAARQHGLVTRPQLMALGIGPDAIDRRIARDGCIRSIGACSPWATGGGRRSRRGLAAVVTEQHLMAAFDEAEVRGLTSPASLDALLKRYPGRRGTRAIERVLQDHHRNGRVVPTSVLERHLLALLDVHKLPRPSINRLGAHGEIDATWADHGLIVECDGSATHGTRQAFDDDRAKDRELVVAGWRVIRLTWRQLVHHPDTIARQLAALLSD